MSTRHTIGLEAGMSHSPMTGVANYRFHIVRAVLEQTSSYAFRSFGPLGWRNVAVPGASQGDHDRGEGNDRGQLQKASSTLSLFSRLARLPARVALHLADVRSARLLYSLGYRQNFAMTVRSQQLDLYHAFNFRPPIDPGVPVLPVIHDLSTIRYPQHHPADRVAWLAPLGEIIDRAPLVQTVSAFSKQEIVDVFGVSPENIFIAPPAAAPLYRPLGAGETQRDLAPLDLTYGNFFLSVGTLEPRKNLRTLVAAYTQLTSAERARCPLVVVGAKGWGDLALPMQAEALRSDGSLRFLSSINNLMLRSLYEGARLMLMPSLYEGFGMPVVEALACGTAVAHSRGTSMDEISGAFGRRVFAMDVDDWTQVLREALASNTHADEALRGARVGQAGVFDWHGSAASVIDAYRRLLPG